MTTGGYYFSNPIPISSPHCSRPTLPGIISGLAGRTYPCKEHLRFLATGVHFAEGDWGDYSVTGSYDGTETLDRKMERIMAEKFTEKMEDSE